ncbi:VaFE repeat-containing surface-anchored protein [Paracoccus sp. CPCC 101403]|uniref:VaFE repeat-containing surface-anchored protein n=1 Tax=Paracoccus broussonetiae TaxID=3075834 RepID=A0ABU3E7M3_9RHOB|nr:VaFE repeat-containing surface-anchored protein [Paracoccus sp. CPCC 101403]MDT1060229.1 VaFE repeat-containing surface-anchored protein [Paracoccus sp. CPCC 101403]
MTDRRHNVLIVLTVAVVIAGVPLQAVNAQEGIVLGSKVVEDSDDNRFFLRTGGIARDDVIYKGLTPGQRYTLAAQLFDVAKGETVGEPTFAGLTPEAAEGSTSFQFPVPPNRTRFNIDYAVYLTLYEGEVDATSMAGARSLAEIRDTKGEATVIQVHAVQRVTVAAADAADGDQSLPGQGGIIRATVDYENLVEGYHYTLWGELLKPSGQATGIYASIPDYAPEGKKGSVTMEFTVPKGFEGVALVPSIGLYHKSRVGIDDKGVLYVLPDAKVPVMIASDPNLNVPAKTVAIGTLFEDLPAE